MLRYFLRRLLLAAASLFGISIVLFAVLSAAPGDVFSDLVSNPAVPPEVVAICVSSWAWKIRYIFAIFAGFCHATGRVGVFLCQPHQCRCPDLAEVTDHADRRWNLANYCNGHRACGGNLSGAQTLFIVRSDRRDAVADRLFAAHFFYGLVLILIFSIHLDWLPFIYKADLDVTGWDWVIGQIKQSIMPISVLALYQAASWTRYVRSAILDVIRLDYVTTARAKGISEYAVIIKHVVRNALIPVVTLVALENSGRFRRRDHYRTDFSYSGDRIAAH